MWRRAGAAGLVLAVAVGLLGTGPAAAAPQLTVSPASGPPGTEFVVTGSGFAALPVEIRWGGLSGPVIATALGPAFSVTAVAPESQPNSVPVTAVVTDGSSVSTSSASFQVTTGAAPAEQTTTTEVTTTTTTVAAPPAASIPGGETARPPVSSGARGGLSGGVDGGVDGGMADTTNGAGATGAAATTGAGSAGAAAPSTATTVGASEATIPTVTLPPAGGPGPAPTGQEASTAPLVAGDGVAAPARLPARTSQSAGAVSNPTLLFLGLGLIFGGGVFLAVRNRDRA